jgi:hypothetical protein
MSGAKEIDVALIGYLVRPVASGITATETTVNM